MGKKLRDLTLCVNTCVELAIRSLGCIFFCILLKWVSSMLIIYFKLYAHEYISGYVHMSAGVKGSQKRVWSPKAGVTGG